MINLPRLQLKKLSDFAISILSSVLLTAMTQVVVYPLLGKWLSTAEYGTMLTLIGIINAVGSSLGGALNNAKILLASEYEREHLSGDSNIIASLSALLCFLLTISISALIQQAVTWNIVIIGAVSMLVFFRAFYSAAYRIQINFKKTLISNVCGVLGYAIGIFFVYLSGYWIIAFLCGELFACIYIACTSFIVKEPFKCTKFLTQYITRFCYYTVTNGVSYFITYMDRFFLFPILGAEMVSIYTTASLLGKTLGIVLNPINGVLLSYYCKDGVLSKKQLVKRLLIFSGLAILSYIFIITVGYPVLRFLYPTLAPLAKPYFYIANLGAIILLLGNTLSPTVLRYAKPQWTFIIQSSFAIAYVIMGIGGMRWNGLFGYCIAVLMVNSLRLIMLVAVSFRAISKDNLTYK